MLNGLRPGRFLEVLNDRDYYSSCLTAQDELSGEAHHWETTPTFTPNGHTFAVHSNSPVMPYAPYNRHGALYKVQVAWFRCAYLQLVKPQLRW